MTYTDDMKSIAFKSIFDHKALKKRGSIVDIEINEVVQIENIHE